MQSASLLIRTPKSQQSKKPHAPVAGLFSLVVKRTMTYSRGQGVINIEAHCSAPPEALAHSRRQMPLNCPVAPPSLRELHKDSGGGGGGVAGRPRAARAPKAKFCATSCGTSSAAPSETPCAASFTCSSFLCHLRAGAGGGSRPGRRAPQNTSFFCPPKGCVCRVLYVLALQVSTVTATGPAAPTKGFGRLKSA